MTALAKKVFLAVSMAAAGMSVQAAAPEARGIERFHKLAYEFTLSPPAPEHFKTLCEAALNEQRVTFIGTGEGPAIIAAITPGPVLDPRNDISPKPAFYMREGQQGLSVTPGPVADWAYVWDRNKDGRIDYVAYLIGPNPIKPANAAYNPPPAGKPFESKDQYMAVIKNLRQVFWHMADENFDGEPDAYALMGKEQTGWWRDWVIVRAQPQTLRESTPAFACNYMGATGKPVKCEQGKENALSFSVPGENLVASFPLKQPDAILNVMRALQKASAQCNFKTGDIAN